MNSPNNFYRPVVSAAAESNVNNLNNGKSTGRRSWYLEPFQVLELEVTNEAEGKHNYLQLLPASARTTLKPGSDWYYSFTFYRLRRKNRLASGKVMDEWWDVPSSMNWGEEDPVYKLATKGWNHPSYKPLFFTGKPLNQLFCKKRIIFLCVPADPEQQATLTHGRILQLPGHRHDGQKKEDGSIQTSKGYELVMAASDRVRTPGSKRFNELRYGPLHNPENQPIIEIVRVGRSNVDTTLTIRIPENREDWVKLQNEKVLENLEPLENLVIRPNKEYYEQQLLTCVDHAILKELAPEILAGGIPTGDPKVLAKETAPAKPAEAPAPAPVAATPVPTEKTPPPASPAPTILRLEMPKDPGTVVKLFQTLTNEERLMLQEAKNNAGTFYERLKAANKLESWKDYFVTAIAA